MKTQDLLAALAAERRRRHEMESKLSRALENNNALARGNLRLQEQCARLRGDADLRQHEEGCQRAAAAAREQEAAAKLALLQALVVRNGEERGALLHQLAGKQEVIAYLESKLAERAAAGGSGGSAVWGAGPAGSVAAGEGVVKSLPNIKPAQSGGASAGSLEAAAPAPAGREPRQRVASEEEEALPLGEEASSGSPACAQGELRPAEKSSGHAAERKTSRGRPAPVTAAGAAAGEGAQQQVPSLLAATAGGSAAADTNKTPAPQKHLQRQQTGGTSVGAVPSTIQRTSLRARNTISYAEPSLHSKLRRGDPFTFGAAEATGAGDGKPQGRARTKPRPRFVAGAAQHSGGERREALPPLSD